MRQSAGIVRLIYGTVLVSSLAKKGIFDRRRTFLQQLSSIRACRKNSESTSKHIDSKRLGVGTVLTVLAGGR